MHLAGDGCFRASRWNKGNQIHSKMNLAINNLIIPRKESEERLKAVPDTSAKKNRTECANFTAGQQQYHKKQYENYDETGIMGLVCPRHGVLLSAVDMFGGEKYVYMDLLLEK